MARKPLIEAGSYLEDRIIARDREKSGRAAPDGANIAESNISGHMTDNITDNMTSQTAGQSDFRAVAQRVRQAAVQPPAKPVLKTVTLKLLPALDARIEEHCQQTGRFKQDVLHDALMLYFSVLESDDLGG